MRQIGKKEPPNPSRTPAADNLAQAALHQRSGAALAAIPTTGIAKGIYRFQRMTK